MNKIAVTKKALSITAQIGAGTIVYALVRNNVVPVNVIQKIALPAATFALGGAVARVASTEMEKIVDEVVEVFNNPDTKIFTL